MGLILRHGAITSKLVVNVVTTKCDPITLHNTNDFTSILVVPWGA
jgi:hypothetical protein